MKNCTKITTKNINKSNIKLSMKKIILPGLVAGIVLLVFSIGLSILASFLLPGLSAQYQTSVFRPWDDPRMWLYFLYPFAIGLVLSWVWNQTKSLVKAPTPYKRGIKFGLAAFFVITIPGMLITYSCFNISLLMILTWTVSGLLDGIISGLIFSKMNK